MSTDTPAQSPRASAPPPPSSGEPTLHAGLVRVQVAAARIEPFLAKSRLFQGVDGTVVQKAAPHFLGLECAPGSTIIAAGGPAEGLGIVFSGRVSVHLPDGSPIEVLEVGDHFGEAALLLGMGSPYTVYANEHCRVLWMQAAVAQSMLGKVPGVAEALGKRLATQVSRLCAIERTQLTLAEVPSVGEVPELPELSPVEEQAMHAQRIPFVELSDYDLQPSALSMVSSKLVRMHRMLPVRLVDTRLTVAMVRPRDHYALAELQRTLQNVELEIVAISQDDFNQAVVKLKLDPAQNPKSVRAGQLSIPPDSLVFETIVSSDNERDAASARTVGEDIIRLVNRIIITALDREASDIHIEPAAGGGGRVRFRVHGVLTEWNEQIPTAAVKPISARIKVLAGLDITERRVPQDGRIGFSAGKRDVDLRVSTLPANRGEKIVLRILEASASTRHIEAIFFEPHTLAAVQRALHRPYGGIVVAGPTSSGKSTSVYGLMCERMVVRPDNNVMMVEDPIEYRMPGVTQVQVNPGAGLGFAQVLRAMLRQDPDTIIVGETRDEATAQLALEAAMTGHLLLTSLHANNAVAALQRLESFGCSRALISQSLVLVLVQRLVRRLCSSCRRIEVPPAALVETLVARKVITHEQAAEGLPRAVGCDACNQTGYVGRLAVCEALEITEDLKTALTSSVSLQDLEQLALRTGALMPFAAYSAALLQRQLVSASEVLLTVAD